MNIGKKYFIYLFLCTICNAALLCSWIHAKEIKYPSAEFTKKTLDIAFPIDITKRSPEYFIVRIFPSFGEESQIIIAIGRDGRAQIDYRKASVSLEKVFYSDVNNSEERVAELMMVQQEKIVVPDDVIIDWIKNYWINLEKSIPQMRNKPPNEAMLDGTHYIIEYYNKQNKIVIDIVGSENGENKLDIKPMLEWLASIRKFIEKAPMDNPKRE